MLNELRKALYAAARVTGDVNAIKKGPEAMIKRQARKVLYKQASKGINKLFK